MLLESNVSPPAKYFTQFASENSAGKKIRKKNAPEKRQIQQLKNISKNNIFK